MKASVIYNNHEITLDRTAMSTALFIDGIEVDKQIGLFERDKNHTFAGIIKQEDGTMHSVCVEFKCGFPKEIMNSVYFKVDGELIGKAEVL